MDGLVKQEANWTNCLPYWKRSGQLKGWTTPRRAEAFKDQRDTITEPEEIPRQFLDTVINALQEAMDGLVKQESKLDKLLALLEEADGKESDYTPESWEAFKDQRTPSQSRRRYRAFLDTGDKRTTETMDGLVKQESKLDKLAPYWKNRQQRNRTTPRRLGGVQRPEGYHHRAGGDTGAVP